MRKLETVLMGALLVLALLSCISPIFAYACFAVAIVTSIEVLIPEAKESRVASTGKRLQAA